MNTTPTHDFQQPVQAKWRHLRDQVCKHPFLKGLTHGQLATLTDFAVETQFQPGQSIFNEGDSADRFYLISDGEIVLETEGPNGPLVVQTLGADDVLGWSWMFPPYKWHFSARAVEPTTAIFFYANSLRMQCDGDPEFGYKLMNRIAKVVIERLQTTRRTLVRAGEMWACSQRAPCHDQINGKEVIAMER